MNAPQYSIKFNRENRDYDIFVDGEYKGSESSYHAAEVKAQEIVYGQLTYRIF